MIQKHAHMETMMGEGVAMEVTKGLLKANDWHIQQPVACIMPKETKRWYLRPRCCCS